MNTELNKKVALEYFAVLAGGSAESITAAIEATMSEDVIWHSPISAPISGTTKGRKAILDLLTGVTGVQIYTPGTMVISYKNVVAEGDLVVVQFQFRAVLRNGTPYENEFIFIFRLKDGRIVEYWETLDTLHMHREHSVLKHTSQK